MWYLLLFTLILGLIMLPFILYWEAGIPLVITVPLWYVALPAFIINWVAKKSKREREAFGNHLLPDEEGVVSDIGKDLYRQFVENCTKCCMFADGSVHVVLRVCGMHGEWLGRDARPDYFAFELGYSGPLVMRVFEDSSGSYEPYADERHENAKPEEKAIRVIWPKYMITNKKGNNTEQILRYLAVLTNHYVKNSATDEKYSFMRGYKINMSSKESRRMIQFFVNSK